MYQWSFVVITNSLSGHSLSNYLNHHSIASAALELTVSGDGVEPDVGGEMVVPEDGVARGTFTCSSFAHQQEAKSLTCTYR